MIEETFQILNVSKIAADVGLEVDQFATFIIGSIIVGLSGLTFFYYVYKNDSKGWWDKLKYLEKSIISFIIGAFCIINTFLIITGIEAISNRFDSLLKPLVYIGPFFYFMIIEGIIKKKSYMFIKEFIRVNIRILAILFFIVLLIFSIRLGNYKNSFEIISVLTSLIILFVSLKHKFNKKFKQFWFILFMITLGSLLIFSLRFKSYALALLNLIAIYNILKNIKLKIGK